MRWNLFFFQVCTVQTQRIFNYDWAPTWTDYIHKNNCRKAVAAHWPTHLPVCSLRTEDMTHHTKAVLHFISAFCSGFCSTWTWFLMLHTCLQWRPLYCFTPWLWYFTRKNVGNTEKFGLNHLTSSIATPSKHSKATFAHIRKLTQL